MVDPKLLSVLLIIFVSLDIDEDTAIAGILEGDSPLPGNAL